MNEQKEINYVVTEEMFEAFIHIKNKYVHDEKSFRHFFFYLTDFTDELLVKHPYIRRDIKRTLKVKR